MSDRPANAAHPAGSLLEAIGNTPLLPLSRRMGAWSPGVEIYLKAEWFNPGGSVKDRPVRQIILDAEGDGRLTSERTILDSSSGNAGIAYAMIGAARGYRVHLVVPANISTERRDILQAYGAEVEYSDALEGSDGAILVARHRALDAERYFYADQYNNPSNPRAHYETTGPEIFAQTGGRVTHFVAGLGTSGTLVGAGRRLRELRPPVQIVAVEPDGAVHGLEGLKHMATAIVPGIYDPSVHDRKIPMRTDVAYETTRRLARDAGLLVGPSSGAAVAAALEVAGDLRAGVIVVLCPDGGDRYLSTAVWRTR